MPDFRVDRWGAPSVGSDRTLRMDFAVLLTVKTMQFLYNRRKWVAL